MKILELADLTAQQIAPLEAAVAGYPEMWQELARSHYCVLLSDSLPLLSTLEAAARLAADLARGLGQHLGGDGYYIPRGWYFAADAKSLRVVQAWRAGRPLAAIAHSEDITIRRVRQIIAAWQRERYEQAQGKLDL
jgi:Mor family transcriptional regulator